MKNCLAIKRERGMEKEQDIIQKEHYIIFEIRENVIEVERINKFTFGVLGIKKG